MIGDYPAGCLLHVLHLAGGRAGLAGLARAEPSLGVSPGLLHRAHGFNSRCYIRIAEDRVNDLAVLHLVGVREMNIDRYVAAHPAVRARVADDPRVSIDVLVYLCPELVVGSSPAA